MCQSCKNKEELERYIQEAMRQKWKEEKRAYRKRLKEKLFSVHKEKKSEGK